MKKNGTAKGNDSENYQGSVSVNTKMWDKVQISGKLAGSVAKTKAFNKVTPYTYASKTSRVIAAFDDEGTIIIIKTIQATCITC